MSGDDRKSRRTGFGHEIQTSLRVLLLAVGMLSWVAGGIATFTGLNDLGSAALILTGCVTAVVGLMGRWPSRVSVSGNELMWAAVDETVEEQIRLVKGQDGEDLVAAELRLLRQRLAQLMTSGDVPTHPAETYDHEVEEALSRVAARGKVRRTRRSGAGLADFAVEIDGQVIHVETKWRAEQGWPYRGSTLARQIARLPEGSNLLVVVNATDVSDARARYESEAKRSVRIVSWLSESNDAELAAAVRDLLAQQRIPLPEGDIRARVW